MKEPKERRSDMRAAIATVLHKHGLSSAEIDDVMNEAYQLNMKCKQENIDVFVLFQSETGLQKI